MAESNDIYSIGYTGVTSGTSEPGFWIYGSYVKKDTGIFQ
jgi:hypothetical protein